MTHASGAQMGSPAGWYPDPYGQSPLRWWDGSRWTHRKYPEPHPEPVASAETLAGADFSSTSANYPFGASPRSWTKLRYDRDDPIAPAIAAFCLSVVAGGVIFGAVLDFWMHRALGNIIMIASGVLVVALIILMLLPNESVHAPRSEDLAQDAEQLVAWNIEQSAALKRTRSIPQHVKVAVSHRDGARCVNCNSNVDIQFDHKVPFSRGGSNTVENIQLLCGRCNRQKGASGWRTW